MAQGHEPHLTVHSVFCFKLLFVCVLHALYVCLEGHPAPPPTPCERKTVYDETLFGGTLVYSPLCLEGFVVKRGYRSCPAMPCGATLTTGLAVGVLGIG